MSTQALQVLLACGHDIRAAWKAVEADSTRHEGTLVVLLFLIIVLFSILGSGCDFALVVSVVLD